MQICVNGKPGQTTASVFERLSADLLEGVVRECVNGVEEETESDVNINMALVRVGRRKPQNNRIMKNAKFREIAGHRLIEGGEKKDFRRAVKESGEKDGSDLVAVLCDVFDTVTERGWDRTERGKVWQKLLCAGGCSLDGSEVRIRDLKAACIATRLRLVSKGFSSLLAFSFGGELYVDNEDMHTNCGSTTSRLAAAKYLQTREHAFHAEIDTNEGATPREVQARLPMLQSLFNLRRNKLFKDGAAHAKKQAKNAMVEMMGLADALPPVCRAELTVSIVAKKIARIGMRGWGHTHVETTKRRLSVLCCSRPTGNAPEPFDELWGKDEGFGIGYGYGRSRMEFDSLKCNNADYRMCTRQAVCTARLTGNKRKRYYGKYINLD